MVMVMPRRPWCERSVGAVPTQAVYSPMLRRTACPRDGALPIWGVLAADGLGPSNLPIQYRFGSLNHASAAIINEPAFLESLQSRACGG
jgi:hypothetical protein